MWSSALKKILIIDNTFDPPHGSPEIASLLHSTAKELGQPVEVTSVRAPDQGIPKDLERFDGAVLSGSRTRVAEDAPWIDLEMEAIRKLHSLKIPTLGICYGEQLIARTLGGKEKVSVAKTPEHGWAEIQVVAESKILKGLSEKFYTFEYHNDEVRELPNGFRLTASNAACGIQAYDLENAPMWGLQFHPERGLEEGNRGLDRRLKENPNFPALNREKSEKLYDVNVGKTIFKNFLSVVFERR